MHAIERATWIAQPWKNGRGTTLEILRWPARADIDDGRVEDAYDLRVSLADVTASCPFSTFPGYRRHTFLVGPAPIQLGNIELVAIGDHIDLPGDRALEATVRAGPTRLLNILTRIAIVVGHGPTAHPVRFAFDLATTHARASASPETIDTRGCVWFA